MSKPDAQSHVNNESSIAGSAPSIDGRTARYAPSGPSANDAPTPKCASEVNRFINGYTAKTIKGIGESARQTMFNDAADNRYSINPPTRTASACPMLILPLGSSRDEVRGFFASM